MWLLILGMHHPLLGWGDHQRFQG